MSLPFINLRQSNHHLLTEYHPSLLPVVCMVGGILVGETMPATWLIMGIFVLPLLLLSTWLLRGRLLTLVLMVVAFVFGSVLMLYSNYRYQAKVAEAEALFNNYSRHECFVISAPKYGENHIFYDAQLQGGALDGCKIQCAFAYDDVPEAQDLAIGDHFCISTKLYPFRQYANADFDYPAYMRHHGYYGRLYINSMYLTESACSYADLPLATRVKVSFGRMRQRLIRRISDSGAEGEDLALLVATSLGERGLLSKQLRQDFSDAGISHVLALSGMHLTLIFSVLVVLLSYLRMSINNPFVRSATLVMMWMYVFLVGMQPSLLRAAVMLTVTTLLTARTRNILSLNVLVFTVALMLVFEPAMLFDVGFQLSVAAMLSIAVFYHMWFRSLLEFFTRIPRLVRYIIQTILLSLSAQVATMPLVAYYFGNLSAAFLFTNILVTPMLTLLLVSTFAYLLLPVPGVSWLLGHAMRYSARALGLMAHEVAGLDGLSLNGMKLEWWHAMLMMAVLILMAWGLTRLMQYCNNYCRRHPKRHEHKNVLK